jgi:hypothetical protein
MCPRSHHGKLALSTWMDRLICNSLSNSLSAPSLTLAEYLCVKRPSSIGFWVRSTCER